MTDDDKDTLRERLHARVRVANDYLGMPEVVDFMHLYQAGLGRPTPLMGALLLEMAALDKPRKFRQDRGT